VFVGRFPIHLVSTHTPGLHRRARKGYVSLKRQKVCSITKISTNLPANRESRESPDAFS
jgi:hypothetical protein